MKTNPKARIAAACLAAYAAAVCTLAALLYYPAFYWQVIAQNPMAIQYLFPVAFVVAGLACAIRCLAAGKLKRPGRFAPAGALLTGLLTVGLGLATPYRVNLLTSRQALLIQTMDLIVSFVSCAAFLFLLMTAALTLYSAAARLRQTGTTGWAARVGLAVLFAAAAVSTALMGLLVGKYGYSLFYLGLGAGAAVIGVLSLIAARISGRIIPSPKETP